MHFSPCHVWRVFHGLIVVRTHFCQKFDKWSRANPFNLKDSLKRHLTPNHQHQGWSLQSQSHKQQKCLKETVNWCWTNFQVLQTSVVCQVYPSMSHLSTLSCLTVLRTGAAAKAIASDGMGNWVWTGVQERQRQLSLAAGLEFKKTFKKTSQVNQIR